MASAHGAGFRVLPLVMAAPADVHAASASHAHTLAASSAIGASLSAALAVHALTYLAVTALIAWLIYARVGLAILRTAWFNLDWLWACVLVLTGALVLVA
jgi:hypothetical protein